MGSLPVQKKLEQGNSGQPFKEILIQFYKRKGITFAKFPTVGGKEIDLQRLLVLIVKSGGPGPITARRGWKRIWEEMGLPMSNTSGSTTIRQFYEKYLQVFDEETNGGREFDAKISKLIQKEE